MENIIKEQCEKLLDQRESLLMTLMDLNENLPNYELKAKILENQISNIDMKINDNNFHIKDIEIQKMNLTINN